MVLDHIGASAVLEHPTMAHTSWKRQPSKTGLEQVAELLLAADNNADRLYYLKEECTLIEEHEVRLSQRLEDIEVSMRSRMAPLQDRLRDFSKRKEHVYDAIETITQTLLEPKRPDPAGHSCLRWVDGKTFELVSSLVILANFGVLIAEFKMSWRSEALWYADQAFLAWYILELTLKTILHERDCFIGKFSVVWWHWLDLFIIIAGVLDQWALPLLERCGAVGRHHLQNLRVVRLFRLARFVKVVAVLRRFLSSDLTWLEGRPFQFFIMGVIIVNTVTLGLELDISWEGWKWIDQAMLAIYCIEMTVRLKHDGVRFFYREREWQWNWLDFTIVASGVLDCWMRPVLDAVIVTVGGSVKGQVMGDGMGLLRILRLLRVLRLARLVRDIKPLHKLLQGVMNALDGLKWVMLLTGMLLYAFAILCTTLIGHGLFFPFGEDSDEKVAAADIFGTVGKSLFTLFKLMSDDQSVVAPLMSSLQFKLLFVIVMAVFNWCILAILTSVVSDIMITSTRCAEREEEVELRKAQRRTSTECLHVLFSEVCGNRHGTIDEHEFDELLKNEEHRHELCRASGLSVNDLHEIFCYASEAPDEENAARFVYFADLISALQQEGNPASERTMFRLEEELRAIEHQNAKRFDHILEVLHAHPSERPELKMKSPGRKQLGPRSFRLSGSSQFSTAV